MKNLVANYGIGVYCIKRNQVKKWKVEFQNIILKIDNFEMIFP